MWVLSIIPSDSVRKVNPVVTCSNKKDGGADMKSPGQDPDSSELPRLGSAAQLTRQWLHKLSFGVMDVMRKTSFSNGGKNNSSQKQVQSISESSSSWFTGTRLVQRNQCILRGIILLYFKNSLSKAGNLEHIPQAYLSGCTWWFMSKPSKIKMLSSPTIYFLFQKKIIHWKAVYPLLTEKS